MLKGGIHVRDPVAHIQAQRDTTSSQMAVHSRCHRADQFPKLAAAVCDRKQDVSELCHRNINMLVVRIATNAEMRTGCLEHKATGVRHRTHVLDDLVNVEL